MAGFGIAAGNPHFPEKTAVRSIDKALAMCGIRAEDVEFLDMPLPRKRNWAAPLQNG
jgi:hypothetical protein